MITRVLEILGSPSSKVDAIRDILHAVKEFSGIEAVGIRLSEGYDYPYYQTYSFPISFVEAERYLCAKDKDGNHILEPDGKPLLECMCGNVMQGRTNPALPFFTEKGSFWTNSTTDLLKSTNEEERQSKTRNRCNSEGYESVALIPLRSNGETAGLLQLNDHRRDMFTIDTIMFYEKLGASIGIALMRRKMEKHLNDVMAELDSSNRNLDEVHSSISNDLRQPLQSIEGSSKALMQKYAGQFDKEGQDHLKRLEGEMKRIGELVNGTLKRKREKLPSNEHRPVALNGYTERRINDLERIVRDEVGDLKSTLNALILKSPSLSDTGPMRIVDMPAEGKKRWYDYLPIIVSIIALLAMLGGAAVWLARGPGSVDPGLADEIKLMLDHYKKEKGKSGVKR
jgi:hypothetical protein